MGGHEGAEKNSDKSTETIARCSCCRNKGSFQQCCLPIKDSASMDMQHDLVSPWRSAQQCASGSCHCYLPFHIGAPCFLSALLCFHPARTRMS